MFNGEMEWRENERKLRFGREKAGEQALIEE